MVFHRHFLTDFFRPQSFLRARILSIRNAFLKTRVFLERIHARSSFRRRLYFVCVLTGPSLYSFGQTAIAADDVRLRYDNAFEDMRTDPGNAEKALAYATAAIAFGDLEGAIGALDAC